jgi:hypothetical protein
LEGDGRQPYNQATLDPLNNIFETNENNNEYSVNIFVKPASLKIRAQEGVNVTVDGVVSTVGPSKEITQDGKGVVKDVKEMTGNVKNAAPQVPELMKTTQETTEDADKLIQGLQNHWLLRFKADSFMGKR